MTTRTETDSLGEVQVPRSALYGAQTQRALNHAQIAPWRTMPLPFLHAMALLKSAAAQANAEVDALRPALAAAIVDAAEAVASGHYDDAFPVPVFQTGSGTSSNMNMNEVLASLASNALGERVHPNDHVNCSQSSNDVVPSATALAAAREIHMRLLPALGQLEDVLCQRGDELEAVVKTGRTHLMDAMPVTLGFELRTWAAQLQDCRQRLTDLQPRLCALAIGGAAVPASMCLRVTWRLCWSA